jgi:tetratricopeptide (TPR) repeat protein
MSKNNIFREIELLADNDIMTAFERCSQLINENPRSDWPYSLRSYVNTRLGKYEEGLSDIEMAIKISPENPINYLKKASYLSSQNNFLEAIVSYSDCIEFDRKSKLYYFETFCLLERAFCYCKIAEFERAEEDLLKLDDDMQTWSGRIWTKADLLEACRSKQME